MLRRRARCGAARTAVVAHAIHGGIVDDGLVINVRNICRAHVVYGAVVIKLPIVPVSALIADTGIAEAVNDSAVEADLRSPITRVPNVTTIAKSPKARGPQHTDCWSLHPGPGHPVIAVRTVSPIPRRPDITGGGTNGLLVYGKRGRGNVDRYRDLRLSRGG